jgi:chromosome segregation ATPase
LAIIAIATCSVIFLRSSQEEQSLHNEIASLQADVDEMTGESGSSIDELEALATRTESLEANSLAAAQASHRTSKAAREMKDCFTEVARQVSSGMSVEYGYASPETSLSVPCNEYVYGTPSLNGD